MFHFFFLDCPEFACILFPDEGLEFAKIDVKHSDERGSLSTRLRGFPISNAVDVARGFCPTKAYSSRNAAKSDEMRFELWVFKR